ncbi:unnamed protein product [Rotaria sp. Silwood2]|nr:unnamed protein product [Rotaria sp. Silwood2]
MAKLFLYDLVASMKAENYFLVLAMNDRRLFTLMTADPIAPDLQEKIQTLPSSSLRFVTRLNGRHSQAKTNTVNGTLLKFIELFSKNVKSIDVKQLVHDSDEENHDNNLNVDLPIATNDHQYIEDDLNDIRQKHWNMISNK